MKHFKYFSPTTHTKLYLLHLLSVETNFCLNAVYINVVLNKNVISVPYVKDDVMVPASLGSVSNVIRF